MIVDPPPVKPAFERPPIIEVAATINFEPIDPKNLALGLNDLWANFSKGEYSRLDFKNDPPEFTGSHLEISPITHDSHFIYPKYWFESEDRADLVQISHKKIVFNWRRMIESDKNKYKSFEHVWEKFFSAVKIFEKTFQISLRPTSAELAYFNMIKFTDFGGSLANVGSLYPSQSWMKSMPWLGEPNAFNFTWNIPDPKENRNTIIQSLTGVEVLSGDPMLRLEIITKSHLNDESFIAQSVEFKKWYEKSHFLLVNTFLAMTSDEMQTVAWKRGKDNA